jgi:hypothetical protein
MQKKSQYDYFSACKWTIADLRHSVHQKTGRFVTRGTIGRWRQHLDIAPEAETLLYTDSDRDAIVGMARWLSRGGKIKPYADKYKQWINQESEKYA